MNKSRADQIDAILSQGLLSPPPDFAERVMIAIQQEESAIASAKVRSLETGKRTVSRLRSATEWLALTLATAIGVTQTIAYIFGLWSTSIAG